MLPDFCSRGRNFTLLGSFGWSDNVVEIRRINRRKEPGLITYVHVVIPHTREVPGQKVEMRSM